MEFRRTLKTLVEDEQSKWGRIFNLVVKILIVLSLISISVESLPGLDSRVIAFLELFELITVLLFTIEYILRVLGADKKLKFIFSFYGIIDLVAILPFYIAIGLDLRSVRIFRLLRIIRMMKFSRYNDAINRLTGAFQSIKAELVVFFMITLCVLYVSALGIYYFENPAQPDKYVSVFHSLWWSVATLTTVGYGDVYPITIGGRIFTFFILMIGLGLISVPTGLIASALTKTLKNDNEH
ncbi:ion transporter [Balneolales bacterium ANBcel1]|nr:ion transporter [Balneolales bacterium ANBcel1]